MAAPTPSQNVCADCLNDLSKMARHKWKLSSHDRKKYCISCYHKRFDVRRVATPQPMSEDDNEIDDTRCLRFPFRRTPISHQYCIFDGHDEYLVDVPRAARVQIFMENNIYITPRSRCCPSHLNAEKHFDNLSKGPKIEATAVDLSVAEITSLLSDMAAEFRESQKKGMSKRFDDFGDDEMRTYTSLDKVQFDKMVNIIKECEDIKEAKASLATGVYLMKLRTGNSQDQIAKFVGISQSTVSRYCEIVRKKLVEFYVPEHYGTERLTSETIKANTTEIASALFGRDNLIVVCDGTYISIQKSSNYEVMRKSFCVHKKTNLLKPFIVVTTNGKIITAYEAFPGSTSDSTIMRSFMQTPEFTRLFPKGTIFILDRGFQFVKQELEDAGYTVRMPYCGKSKQMEEDDANMTRFVTKIRWVVEAYNGRFKSMFRFFDGRLQNTGLPHMFDDLKVACALIDDFTPPFYSDVDDPSSVYERMLSQQHKKNNLADVVARNNLIQRRSHFTLLQDTQDIYFPRLSLVQLRNFGCGAYQLAQARSYYAEHLTGDEFGYEIKLAKDCGVYNFQACGINVQQDDAIIIHVRLQSRHISNKMYSAFLLINKSLVGVESIVEHYCQCRSGKRTVGCCAHIMSVIWYLAYARHLDDIPRPAAFLDEVVAHNNVYPETDDDDDDDK